MALEDKLIQINEVKKAIKQALINKNVDMTGVPFTEYASKIEDAVGDRYTTCSLAQFTAAGSKAVAVPGVAANSAPVLDVLVSSSSSADSILNDWSKIYRGVTSSGQITFYASGATTQALTVQVKGY